MRSFSFVTVDVFTDRRFGGNPLAVFPDARGLTDTEMQALAADYDAGRIALKQMGEKAAYIRRGYWRACDCNPSGRGSGCDWNPFVQSTDLTPPGVQVASSP